MADDLDDDDFIIVEDDNDDDLEAWLELAALKAEGLEPEDDDTDEDELTEEQLAQFMAQAEAKRCLPKPFKHKASKKRIAVVDTETDPFSPGLIVKPFTLGFDDGERYVDFWGDDCVDQFFAYLATLDDDYIIYAHNGGKFDFYFFLKYLDPDQSPMIMNGRLVKVFFGKQEFRDSYCIIPQALSAYKKDEVDYSTFTRDKRERHRAAILEYQRADCRYTRELIIGFHDLFGDKLTIASASLPMLHSFTGFERMGGAMQDDRFRPYYFGGRNQCFETGVLRPKASDCFKVYDRNSMYPAVMRDDLHPVSVRPELQRDITEETDFALIDAWNDGALPMRMPNNSLDFTVKYGTFHATIHEIRAGLDTGTLRINRVRHAWAFDRKATFDEFVAKFYGLRLEAKANDDKVRDILYKFCLNSGYGKFALNPRKFKQWLMTVDEIPSPLASDAEPGGWSLHTSSGNMMIWSRPAPRQSGFYNVATAASITGAARANLLRNLANASRPVYCDTDSIICEGFTGELNDTELGGWKLEATGDVVAIGGKKLYAVFNKGDAIKKASKGVSITPAEIVSVCNGQEIVYQNPVPNFKLDGSASFVTRRVNRTGNVK